MIDVSKFNSVDASKALSYSNFQSVPKIENSDISIFAENNLSSDESIDALYTKLSEVEDKQGVFSNAWNDIKETTGLGTSVEKCDEAIQKYQKGEITFEEASEIIDKFAEKQDNSLNLFSNIATSAAAIAAVAAATVLTGGIGAVAAVAIGAGAGAITKTGFKLTDRATNEIENDALDAKQIAKDTLSGALTGGMAAYTMGTAGSVAEVGVKKAAISCAKTGAKTGALGGSANYTIDCAFDENKEFKVGDMMKSTATGAVVGATVGGVMGAANGLLRTNGLLDSGCSLDKMLSVENASVKNVAANSVCSAEYKVLNDRIRSIAA